MIWVTFYKKDESYYRFESSGHADYDEHGKDIVCAAVSTLAQTLVNALISVATVDPTVVVHEDGFLSCEIPCDSDVYDSDVVQTIFKTVKIGIEGISEVYTDYVELLEEEV